MTLSPHSAPHLKEQGTGTRGTPQLQPCVRAFRDVSEAEKVSFARESAHGRILLAWLPPPKLAAAVASQGVTKLLSMQARGSQALQEALVPHSLLTGLLWPI